LRAGIGSVPPARCACCTWNFSRPAPFLVGAKKPSACTVAPSGVPLSIKATSPRATAASVSSMRRVNPASTTSMACSSVISSTGKPAGV